MGGARGAAIFMLEPERSRSGAGAGACPPRSRCCFSGTINVYFTPIPLTNPTTFCSRTAESEDVKRGMEIGAYPSWSPHPLNGFPHPPPENGLWRLGKCPRYWGGGPMLTGHGGGPRPPVPRGDGPGPKESLGTRARGRPGRRRAGARSVGPAPCWHRRPGRVGSGVRPGRVGSGRGWRSGVLAPEGGRRASTESGLRPEGPAGGAGRQGSRRGSGRRGACLQLRPVGGGSRGGQSAGPEPRRRPSRRRSDPGQVRHRRRRDPRGRRPCVAGGGPSEPAAWPSKPQGSSPSFLPSPGGSLASPRAWLCLDLA